MQTSSHAVEPLFVWETCEREVQDATQTHVHGHAWNIHASKRTHLHAEPQTNAYGELNIKLAPAKVPRSTVDVTGSHAGAGGRITRRVDIGGEARSRRAQRRGKNKRYSEKANVWLCGHPCVCFNRFPPQSSINIIDATAAKAYLEPLTRFSSNNRRAVSV